jgi:type III secretion protein C
MRKMNYTQYTILKFLAFFIIASTPLHAADPVDAGTPPTSTPEAPSVLPTSAPQTPPPAPSEQPERTSTNTIIAAEDTQQPPKTTADGQSILINFNNVSIIEYIRFVSRLSNRNFIFDDNDLNFNVTIVSEEPATINDIMSALLQELRIHNLSMFEEGSNIIIHKNAKVNTISTLLDETTTNYDNVKAEIATQVFRLNTLDPDKAAAILRPLVSADSLIEALKESNSLIITDITANIAKVAELLKNIDGPNSGLVIGQYVSRLTDIEILIPLAEKIMLPISQEQALTFVPQTNTNSIFIVSNPFLVERTISILQYLDQDQGATRILNLKDLKMENVKINPRGTKGNWLRDDQQRWLYQPGLSPEELLDQQRLAEQGLASQPPKGSWTRDYNNNWVFTPGGTGGLTPKGHWVLDKNGNWVYQFDENEEMGAREALSRGFQGAPTLPGGAEKKAQFFIYKLKYRKGVSIEPVIRQIADTIQQNEKGNEELIATLRSVQWLQGPNSLVFSGTPDSLLKAGQLVSELDKPMRQVFIEMLILETTLDDSLEFGVSWATRFGGGNTTGAQSFTSGNSTLVPALATGGVNNLGQVFGLQQPLVPNPQGLTPDSGFDLGVIGQKITHCGQEFGSIGALIHALHDRARTKVVSNPKLLIEDNTPAEIFVGINTPYRTQSLSNGIGNVITSNFEYRDVGTRLRITPYIGNGEIISLEIQEEVSDLVTPLATIIGTNDTSPGPTTNISRTTTRVHIPDKYFLVISGFLQLKEARERNQLPCLGGVPLIGGAFSHKINADRKRNLMLFIRPMIVDNEEQVQELTRRQQNIYDYKNCLENFNEVEVKEALDLFNIKKTLHPEDVYECECD